MDAAPSPSARAPLGRGVWAVVLLYLVVVLRFHDTPLWYDEAVLFLDADRALPGVETLVMNRLVLQVWLPLWGDSLFLLRLLPALIGAAAVALVARAARRAGADPFVAACLAGGAPAVLIQGATLRHYALSVAVAAASVEALLAVAERPTLRRHAALAAVGAASIYVHHTLAATLVGVQVLVLAGQVALDRERRRPRLLGLALVPAVAVLLALPELLMIPAQRRLYTALPQIYPGPSLSAVGEVLRELSPLPSPLWAAIASGLLLAAWVGAGWLRGPRLLLGTLLAGPWAATLAGSIYQPMLVTRVLVPVVPALAVAAALAFPGRVRLRRGLAIATGLAGALHFSAGGWIQDDMRGALVAISARARPGDGLVVHPGFANRTAQANLRLLRVSVPPLVPVQVEAPTWIQAAQLDFAAWPARTFLVLADHKGYSVPLEEEARVRFARLELLATPRGYRVLLAEGPVAPDAALARAAAEPALPARQRFRAGILAFRAGRFEEALARLTEVQLPSGAARDEREERVERAQLAWTTALAAHFAGHPDQARAALAEAERWGLEPPADLRAAILRR